MVQMTRMIENEHFPSLQVEVCFKVNFLKFACMKFGSQNK